jgi:uncharacterized membrane protein YedE/YeeE
MNSIISLDESDAGVYIPGEMDGILATRAPWYIAGPLVGLLVVLLLWLAHKPFGALGGYIELNEWAARSRRELGWRPLFIAGVIVGGLLSALTGTGWRPTLAYGSFDVVFGSALWVKAVVLFSAGLLIGLGGRMAGGCTSGHGVCGTSLGSPASMVCTATFMATAVTCALALAWMSGA